MSSATRNSRKIGIIIALSVGIVVAAIAAMVLSTNAVKPSAGGETSSVEEITAKLLSPSTRNASALGSGGAKVTIVEFGDYQCTWCYRFHEGTKDALVANYVDSGKVRFLFKDFPINDLSDRASSRAAEASYCAADQGKYWEYHDELYNNWNGENPATPWITKSSLTEFASNVGVADIAKFSECLDSSRYAGVVRDNYNLARTIRLDATPSFIILTEGGTPKLLRGAHPYSTFEREITNAYSTSAS
jgi:protein-disulfide isomerase